MGYDFKDAFDGVDVDGLNEDIPELDRKLACDNVIEGVYDFQIRSVSVEKNTWENGGHHLTISMILNGKIRFSDWIDLSGDFDWRLRQLAESIGLDPNNATPRDLLNQNYKCGKLYVKLIKGRYRVSKYFSACTTEGLM